MPEFRLTLSTAAAVDRGALKVRQSSRRPMPRSGQRRCVLLVPVGGGGGFGGGGGGGGDGGQCRRLELREKGRAGRAGDGWMSETDGTCFVLRSTWTGQPPSLPPCLTSLL